MANKKVTAVDDKPIEKTEKKPTARKPAAAAADKPVAKKPAANKNAEAKAEPAKKSVPAVRHDTSVRPVAEKKNAPAVRQEPTAKPIAKKPTVVADKPVAKPAEEKSAKAEKSEKTTVAEIKTEKVEMKPVTEEKTVKAEKQSKKPVEKAKRRVLFVGSEAFPFAGTGGLGEVLGSLPKAVNASGEYDARVIIPLYESFPAERRKDLEFMFWTFVRLSWRNEYCGVFRLKEGNTTYYFIDNERYFKRKGLYGHGDDGERFAFFSMAVLDILPRLDFMPEILHCNDWQTALVPIYYKLFYMYREGYGNIRTIMTIHNIEYQGWYDRKILGDVFGIPDNEYWSVEHLGAINLLKGAIDYSDAVSTVSPTYAMEIKDPYYAHTLDGTLIKNEYKLRGILNGVNTDTYNPETNPSLFAHFSADDKSGKAVNKAELQKLLGLPVEPNVPIIAMITRLATHKGLDIVKAAMNDILARNVQFVLLGTGEHDYEWYFMHMQELFGNKLRAVIAFNTDMSHKIYAGADMFLMPSKSEPCGLSQMMACRYGTIPIVRETGGLQDSITDAYNGDFGNGYKFARYAADDMVNAIDRALGLYFDYHDKWEGLMDRAMRTDFSWDKSAKEYVRFYNQLLNINE